MISARLARSALTMVTACALAGCSRQDAPPGERAAGREGRVPGESATAPAAGTPVPVDSTRVPDGITPVPDGSTRAPASPNDPWDAARARGVSFRAVGNEPGWMLEIVDGEQVLMLADYGEKRVTTPAPEPSKEPSTGDRLYSIRTEAHRLDIRIAALRCQDGMSGFEFPATVTATLDGQTYRGCGRALR